MWKIQKKWSRTKRKNKMTQAEMAERLVVSRQKISRQKSGRTIPSAKMLPEIAKVFEVDVVNLIGHNTHNDVIERRKKC